MILRGDDSYFKNYADKTQPRCPFCRANIHQAVTQFRKEFVEAGIMTVGNSLSFPSNFAHCGEFNGIVVFNPDRHYVVINEWDEGMLYDGLSNASALYRRLHEIEPGTNFASIIIQNDPLAGSSIAHPHMQVIATCVAPPLTTDLVEATRKYFEDHGKSYWADLISTEKAIKERYIGAINGVEFFVPYAAVFHYEINAVVVDKSDFLALHEKNLRALASGISRVLQFYYDCGFRSYNLALCAGPLGEQLDRFSIYLRICPRPASTEYKPVVDSCSWGFLVRAGTASDFPETWAESIKSYF